MSSAPVSGDVVSSSGSVSDAHCPAAGSEWGNAITSNSRNSGDLRNEFLNTLVHQLNEEQESLLDTARANDAVEETPGCSLLLEGEEEHALVSEGREIELKIGMI